MALNNKIPAGNIAEKWGAGFCVFFDEGDRVFHDQAVDVGAWVERNLLAVAHDAFGVVGMGNRLVFPSAEGVEAVCERIRRAGGGRITEPPFAEGARGVAGLLQELRE